MALHRCLSENVTEMHVYVMYMLCIYCVCIYVNASAWGYLTYNIKHII